MTSVFKRARLTDETTDVRSDNARLVCNREVERIVNQPTVNGVDKKKVFLARLTVKKKQRVERCQVHQPSPAMNFNSRGRGPTGKVWVHSPETLQRGHVVYNVKFLGHVEVDQPKGSEMVRDAIRKMKFNKQIKKAEGQKSQKVELTISIDAITIQDTKYKVVQFQYPLHHVSYCADDKSDKRMFTFIAKERDTTKHHCFVFDSEKNAEEITLTVGQAFDLAYRRFLDSSSKDLDAKKQLLVMQKKVNELTAENSQLKERVAVLEKLVEYKKHEDTNGKKQPEPVVGRKLENLILNSPPASQWNDSRRISSPADGMPLPILAPPPPIPSRSNAVPLTPPTQSQALPNQGIDMFGSRPFNVQSPSRNPFSSNGNDVFGMSSFSPQVAPSGYDIDQQIRSMDKELMDLQADFSRGLSFGTEDFSLDDLDPLKK